MEFAQADIADRLDSADSRTLDLLSFGVVKMDLDDVVLEYNEAESRLSGLSKSSVVGRDFFTQVAPCTNNYMVAERYHEHDILDETIEYVFTYRMRPTKVRLRMLKNARRNFQYLLVEAL